MTEVELDELQNDEEANELLHAINKNGYVKKLSIKDQSKLGLQGIKTLNAINSKIEVNLQEYTQKMAKMNNELQEKEKSKQEKIIKEIAEQENKDKLIKEASQNTRVKLITHSQYDKVLARDIAKAILNNTHLEEIIIGEPTASYVSYNSMNYTEISDEYCYITNEILDAIAELLKKGNALKKITFISTYCDDSHLAKVFEAIAINSKLSQRLILY